MARLFRVVSGFLLLAGVWVMPVDPAANFRVVSPQGPYFTIQAALEEAQPGEVIQVMPGRYAGPLVVHQAVTLQGIGWPVIDGEGEGTVVTLAAEGAVIRGFEVRGSGVEPDRDHAGIALLAPRTVAEGNRLSDVLFGIFVAQADGAVVHGNTITSKEEYEVGRKGDSIRVWYSRDVTVSSNSVAAARDVVMWYSSGLRVLNNRIEGGRYGIHLMYCDQTRIQGNIIRNNSVGIYVMYSRQVELSENDIRGQRGPSGYALGFKDADQVRAVDNLLVDNRVGVFLDGTPFTLDSTAEFQRNILAFNDLGVVLMAAVHGATFRGNTFWENGEQVGLQGGGRAGGNTWQENYWSDYQGFDADGDGIGEMPYRSERSFEHLTDREPLLRVLTYSPAAQAIEFAARTFPIYKPQPKLVDLTPSVMPAGLTRNLPAALPTRNAGLATVGSMIGIGGGLLAFCAVVIGWALWEPSGAASRPAKLSGSRN